MLHRFASATTHRAPHTTAVILQRAIHTHAPALVAAAASAVAPSTPATPAAPTHPLQAAAMAAGFPLRIVRRAGNVAEHSKPTFKNGRWWKAELSARDLSRLRKVDLFNGGTWEEHETPRLKRIEPTVLKGHKREKVILERKAKIVEAMKDMDERIEEHWRNERARRIRPTFYQQVTGKKPSGVIAAEEALMKEKKEKNREREKARQASQTK